jgi:hypothetical protein
VQRSGELAEMANRIAAIMASAGPPDSAMRTLRWILAIVAVQSAFSGSEPAVEQLIELVQVSADTPNAFDRRRTGGEKLAGLQLSHFGAFYKRSWRANDWMWGRLDAVGSLLRIVMDPARLRRLAGRDPGFAERFERGLRALALGGDADAGPAVLQEAWDEGRFAWELTFLHDPTVPVPRSLDWCIGAVERRLQLEILQEELPRVAAAVREDWLDGGADRPEARAFVVAVHEAQKPPAPPQAEATWTGGKKPRGRHAVPEDERRSRWRRRGAGPPPEVDPARPLSPGGAAEVFPTCLVGQERIEDEAGTALYAETMNAVAAVGLRAAQRHVEATRESLGREPPPRFTLPVVLPVIRSVAASSRIVYWTMVVLLLAGAGLLAFGLWPDHARWVSTVLGGVLLTLGLAVAMVRMRRGRILLTLALVAVAAVLLAASYSVSEGAVATGWFRATVLGALVLGVMLLAVRRRRRPRPPAAGRAA